MAIQRGLFFPGIGAQYVGMGKELYDTHRLVQEYFEEAAECLQLNMVKLCFAASDIDIMSLEHGPYALFLLEAASGALLRAEGVPFQAVAGVDMVSWYAAAHSASAITLPDCLYMLRKWIELVSQELRQKPQSNLIIDSNEPETIAMILAYTEQARERDALVRVISVAPHQVVIAGTADGVSYLEEMLQRGGVPYQLQVGCAISLSDELVHELRQYLEKIDFHEPKVSVVHPLRGDLITTSSELRLCAEQLFMQVLRVDLLASQMRSWPEVVGVIPAHKLYATIPAIIPGPQWWFMETNEALHALRNHAGQNTP